MKNTNQIAESHLDVSSNLKTISIMMLKVF